jgi:diguanylate cyclase (GGDEF)-like protein
MATLNKLKKRKYDFIAIVLMVFYFYSSTILQIKSFDGEHILILNYKISETIIQGIITEIQMLISVSFVLLGRRKYYLLALVINLSSLLRSIHYAFIHKINESVPYILSYIGAIIIITLIFLYKSKLSKKIMELESKDKELRKLAFFDGLTGILNRDTFIEQLDFYVDYYIEKRKKMYVIFIDVDNFKKINDTFGHYIGDTVLKELVMRIKAVLHEEDIIGRLGGDEIGIIIKRNIETTAVENYIKSLQESIFKAYFIEKKEFFVTVSMGVAKFPTNGNSSLELLKNADIAMYDVKSKGKNGIIYFSEEKA